MTLREIREMLSDAVSETEFCEATNETIYPACWTYGEGAGDATTGDYYDVRIQKSAEHVCAELEIAEPPSFSRVTRQRDAAYMIADALRRQAERDRERDEAMDAEIV